MKEQDRLRRFLFEDAPLRGHWVRLSRSWIEAREHQQLPAPAMELLGEALAATTLLSASLKFSGTLTLQLGGSQGAVSMLVAQVTDQRTVRGVVHVADETLVDAADFAALTAGARLVVSIAQEGNVPPWQGIVPLEGTNLADCLQQYFAASEQLPTVIVLAADVHQAAGLLLQKLPAAAAQGEGSAASTHDLWEEVVAMMATLGPEELLAAEPGQLLGNLFGTHDLRLFDGEPVSFACRCDRERVAAMLRGIGRDEVDSILAEQGEVTVTCEFCQRPYRFDAVDATGLFTGPTAQGGNSLN